MRNKWQCVYAYGRHGTNTLKYLWPSRIPAYPCPCPCPCLDLCEQWGPNHNPNQNCPIVLQLLHYSSSPLSSIIHINIICHNIIIIVHHHHSPFSIIHLLRSPHISLSPPQELHLEEVVLDWRRPGSLQATITPTHLFDEFEGCPTQLVSHLTMGLVEN